MIIDDFDLVRIPFAPDETDAPLIVDADTNSSAPTAKIHQSSKIEPPVKICWSARGGGVNAGGSPASGLRLFTTEDPRQLRHREVGWGAGVESNRQVVMRMNHKNEPRK
jgi:hypothetical protein